MEGLSDPLTEEYIYARYEMRRHHEIYRPLPAWKFVPASKKEADAELRRLALRSGRRGKDADARSEGYLRRAETSECIGCGVKTVRAKRCAKCRSLWHHHNRVKREPQTITCPTCGTRRQVAAASSHLRLRGHYCSKECTP